MAKVNHKIIKSDSRSLSYSMYDFIDAVKQHDGIWNREHEEFHVRELRDRAWFDIARQLYSDFDAATVSEKQKIAEIFAKRWKNTRDSFFRTLRRQEYGDNPHSYIYEKEMSFILSAKGGAAKSSSNHMTKKSIKLKRKCARDKRKPVDDDDDAAGDSEAGNNDSDTTTSLTKSIKTEKNQSKEGLRVSPKKPATKKRILAAKKMRYSDNELVSLLNEEDATIVPKHRKQQRIQQQHDSNDSNEFIEMYSEVTNEVNEGNENDGITKSTTQGVQQQNYETAFITFAKDFTEIPQITTTPASVAATATATPTAVATTKSATAITITSSPTTVSSQAAMPSSFFHSHASDMDADQAFLYSITPAIRSISVEKKLDFQIDVLKLLKSYTTKS